MRRGRGEGEEGKEVHSIHYLPPSLFRFSPSPFPPETPDTQVTVKASVSGVPLLSLPPFFASLFPLFPQKRLILRLDWKRCSVTK